jgi:hypothetical protein
MHIDVLFVRPHPAENILAGISKRDKVPERTLITETATV